MPVIDVVGCIEHEVEVEWEMDNDVRLGVVVESVVVLEMVVVEPVVGIESNGVAQVVVADGCVAVRNRARDTSWLLGKSKTIKICMYENK